MKKKILILGGTGFLGFNIIKKLIKFNYDITSMSTKKSTLNEFKKVKYIYCDIRNLKKLKKKLKNNFDFLINLSGNIDHSNKKMVKDVHYLGVKNLIECINTKKLKLFIQVGTSLEYGKAPSPHKENLICKPVSYYGKYKNLSSELVKNNFDNYIILRPYQIYGANQKTDRLIPSVIVDCLRGKKFSCSDGTQLRDFLHIDDFTDLIIKIIKNKNIKSDVYNVGMGKPYKVKTVINLIRSIIGKGKPLFGKKRMRKDEIMKLYPNISKLKKNLNWKPKIGLIKGIKKTIKSYESSII